MKSMVDESPTALREREVLKDREVDALEAGLSELELEVAVDDDEGSEDVVAEDDLVRRVLG